MTIIWKFLVTGFYWPIMVSSYKMLCTLGLETVAQNCQIVAISFKLNIVWTYFVWQGPKLDKSLNICSFGCCTFLKLRKSKLTSFLHFDFQLCFSTLFWHWNRCGGSNHRIRSNNSTNLPSFSTNRWHWLS